MGGKISDLFAQLNCQIAGQLTAGKAAADYGLSRGINQPAPNWKNTFAP